MILKEIKSTSKKTGNPYTAYQFVVGDWKSSYFFFRGEIEKNYVLEQLKEEGVEYEPAE